MLVLHASSVFNKILITILLMTSVYALYSQPPGHFMVVFLTPSKNHLSVENSQKIENEHLRTISRLADEGILVNAGLFEGGGEVLILNTTSRAETEQLLNNDPAILEGFYNAEILGWTLRYGGICDPPAPYEMKTFSFVRYRPANQIASYKTNVDLDMKAGHLKHVEKLLLTGDVLVEGFFGGNDGGILIYQKDRLDELISQDPAISEGYITIEKKIIWLNKGSFCEK